MKFKIESGGKLVVNGDFGCEKYESDRARESLGPNRSFRFYNDQETAIDFWVRESGRSRNDLVREYVDFGLKHHRLLRLIDGNSDILEDILSNPHLILGIREFARTLSKKF